MFMLCLFSYKSYTWSKDGLINFSHCSIIYRIHLEITLEPERLASLSLVFICSNELDKVNGIPDMLASS